MTTKEFVRWIYPEAVKIGDINPIFITGQAALESGWGNKAIGNNLFGITKGSTWTGPVKLVTTTECFSTNKVSFRLPEAVISITPFKNEKGVIKYRYKVKRFFRMYDSVEDCLKDHLAILKKPIYADAWQYRHDPYLFVEHLSDNIGSKYATDLNYVKSMKSVFKRVELEIKSL